MLELVMYTYLSLQIEFGDNFITLNRRISEMVNNYTLDGTSLQIGNNQSFQIGYFNHFPLGIVSASLL